MSRDRSRRSKERAPSWLAINAYGALIGFLALYSAVLYALDPTGGPLLAAAHMGLGVAGAGLIVSYVASRVDVEAVASIVLVVSYLARLLVDVFSTSPPQFDYRGASIQAAMIVCVSLRVSALMGGETIVVVPPAWPTRKER